MKIVVLEGSPNKNGSSNLLAERFICGAKEAGHSVEVIDAAHANIRPCTGCIHCGYEGPCSQNDDMNKIRQEILDADMIVFVTPLYYYGMSAQLKILIERFCAFNGSIQRKQMRSALLAAAWNSDNWTFEALEAHYHTPVRFRRFAYVAVSEYPQQSHFKSQLKMLSYFGSSSFLVFLLLFISR